MKEPLLRRVQDTVRKVHWKDSHLVALQEAIKKSHRSLLRIAREYNQVLAASMRPFFENLSSLYRHQQAVVPTSLSFRSVAFDSWLTTCSVHGAFPDQLKEFLFLDYSSWCDQMALGDRKVEYWIPLFRQLMQGSETNQQGSHLFPFSSLFDAAIVTIGGFDQEIQERFVSIFL